MGAEDLFCHGTSLEPGESLGPGDKVSFVEEYNEMKGKSEAINVKVLERGTGELPKEGPSESAVETKGQLLRWNHERGFGFIKPEEEEEDILHMSVLLQMVKAV